MWYGTCDDGVYWQQWLDDRGEGLGTFGVRQSGTRPKILGSTGHRGRFWNPGVYRIMEDDGQGVLDNWGWVLGAKGVFAMGDRAWGHIV